MTETDELVMSPDADARPDLDRVKAAKTKAQEQRWAEENALLVEALAGGAAEAE